MGNSPNDPLETQSLQPQSEHYKLAMLYYGFFVVATAGIVLAIYHCLIFKWCADNQSSWPGTGRPTPARNSRGRKPVEPAAIATTYKYTKGKEGGGCEECVVCLSVFEEGEDVRELLKCKHSFHTPCIDTWLSSHFDCPLCRALVAGEPENSGGRFSDSGFPI